MEKYNGFTEIIENKRFKDLNPVIFGYDQCRPNQDMNIPLRPFYLIHYVISGKGKLKLNDIRYTVTAGKIFTIPIHTENYYQADSKEPWEYIWIAFDGDLAKDFSKLPPVVDCPTNIFFEMMEVHNLCSMREEFLAEKLFALYRFLFSQQTPINYPASVKNFIKLNYLDATLSVTKISQNLGLNRSYLARLFMQEYKCSIQEYIIRTRISHSIEFLDKGYSIQQVTNLVGYNDASNFSKIFKKYVGVSPQKYHKQKSNKKEDT